MLLTRLAFIVALIATTNSLLAQLHWVKKESFPAEARHRSSAFSIGNKGYVGGGHINSGVEKTYVDWWEYDPASDSWTQIADYGGGSRYQMATFTLNGVGYAGGGENGTHEYTSDYWKYVPLVNTWFPIADLPGLPRRGSASFVVDDIAYVGLGQSGGPDNGGYELDFYLYDEAGDAWYPIADFIGTARTGGVGFGYNGKGYVGTGHMVGAATKDFFEYNPSTDTWTQLADVDTTLRQDATGFVLNGKGYILTGNDLTGEFNYDDVWEYDFDADTWTLMPEFPGDARRYMVSFVIDNRAYCGAGTDGTNLNDFWMFDPTYNGIEEQNLVQFELFPNPANEFVNLRFSDEINELGTTYQLLNTSGKLIHSGSVSEKEIQIDCTPFTGGSYMLLIYRGNEVVGSTTLLLK